MFFNVCLHSHSFPLRADWQKSDSSVEGEPQGNWNSNSIDAVSSSPSFSRPAERVARRACSQATSLFTMELDFSKGKISDSCRTNMSPKHYIWSYKQNGSIQVSGKLPTYPPPPPLNYKINTYILSRTKC